MTRFLDWPGVAPQLVLIPLVYLLRSSPPFTAVIITIHHPYPASDTPSVRAWPLPPKSLAVVSVPDQIVLLPTAVFAALAFGRRSVDEDEVGGRRRDVVVTVAVVGGRDLSVHARAHRRMDLRRLRWATVRARGTVDSEAQGSATAPVGAAGSGVGDVGSGYMESAVGVEGSRSR